MLCTRMTTLAFGVISLCFVLKVFWCLCNSNTIRNILMVFSGNVEQVKTKCHIQE